MTETLHISKNEDNFTILTVWQVFIMEEEELFGALEINDKEAESIKIKIEADKIKNLLWSLYLWAEENGKKPPSWHIEEDEV